MEMDQSLINELLRIDGQEQLSILLGEYTINTQHIEWLKDIILETYSKDPSYAEQLAHLAYRIGQLLPDPARGAGHWALGSLYLSAANFILAEYHLSQARLLFILADAHLDAARLSVGLIGILTYIGQIDRAMAIATEIEPILAHSAATDTRDRLRLAKVQNNLGIVYEARGDYEDALAVYDRALALLSQLSDSRILAYVHNNRAYALGMIGDIDSALEEFQLAEMLFQGLQSWLDIARLLMSRTQLLFRANRLTEAEITLARVKELLYLTHDSAQITQRLVLLNVQLQLLTRRGIDQTLLSNLKKTRTLFVRQGSLLEEGDALMLLGHYYLRTGDLSKATYWFSKARKRFDSGADRTLEFRALFGLAKIRQLQGKQATSLKLYYSSIEKLEMIRGDLQIELFRTTFMLDRLDIYRDLADYLIQLGRIEEAWQIIERAKSRLISEKLASRLTTDVSATTELSQPLVVRLRQLLRELDETYQEVRNARLRASSQFSSELSTTHITLLETEIQQLLVEIQRQQPSFSKLSLGQIVSRIDLDKILKDSLFLHYYAAQEQFAVFIISANSIPLHIELAPIASIESAYSEFVTSLERTLGMLEINGLAAVEKRISALLAATNKHLTQLYELLIKPIEKYFDKSPKLIISPDGILHSIPFHALNDGECYLIEKYEIGYVPSATVLHHCASHIYRAQGSFLVGYEQQSLMAIRHELNTLFNLYPQATLATNQEATAERFLEYAPTHRHIHIAAHASFRADKPMLSSIALADRRLALGEILQLRLQTDLVVLSGCETGFGQLHGTDLISLASGFLGAGANTLLVSYWKVEDASTAYLMEQFYRAIQAGATFAAALRVAQLELLAQGRKNSGQSIALQHPAFWAPFAVLGYPYGVLPKE